MNAWVGQWCRLDHRPRGPAWQEQEKEQSYYQNAVDLAGGSAMPATGSLVSFFEKSTFALGAGNMDGYVQVQGKGLVGEADKVTMWVEGSTFKPYKTEYSTQIDGATMTGTVTYAATSDGELFYVASHVVSIPDKSLTITESNSDLEAIE